MARGTSTNNGRVEIWKDGYWYTLCDEEWDLDVAHVVCRNLGYLRAINATKESFFGVSSNKILGRLKCDGDVSSTESCTPQLWDVPTCNNYKEAGVVCEGISDIRKRAFVRKSICLF